MMAPQILGTPIPVSCSLSIFSTGSTHDLWWLLKGKKKNKMAAHAPAIITAFPQKRKMERDAPTH